MSHALLIRCIVALGCAATVASAQPVVVYDSDGFETHSLGTVHGQNAGAWHAGVINSNSSPMYRHWEVKSGSSADAVVINTGGSAGRVLSLEGPVSLWLQLGWAGAQSAGGQFVNDPQIVTVEFDMRQASGGGTIDGGIRTYRANQGTVQSAIRPRIAPSGVGTFEATLGKGSTANAAQTHSFGSYSGSAWHHVKIVHYHPRPQGSQNGGVKAFVRVWLDGTELTAGDSYYTWNACWTGYMNAVEFDPSQISAGASFWIDNVKVTWDRYLPPANVRWMGFWHYEVESLNPPVTIQTDGNLNVLAEGVPAGTLNLLDVQNVFFVTTFSPSGEWQSYRLRADYDVAWKALVDLVSPFYGTYGAYGSIGISGFTLGDEPVWSGVTIAELTTAANTIRSSFPSAVVAWTDALAVYQHAKSRFDRSIFDRTAPPPVPTPSWTLPSNVNWISPVYYDASPESFSARALIGTHVYPKMTASQRVVLTPQAYSPDASAADQSAMMGFADQYYFWATCDPKVVGLNPWHWHTFWYPDRADWKYGVRDMSTLRPLWESIGRAVKVNNQLYGPLPPPFTKMQGFEAFVHGEALPSTYAYDPFPGGTGPAVAPPTSKVVFSRATTNTSIRMTHNGDSTPCRFRYTWGTPYTTVNNMWDGHPTQVVKFNVWVSGTADGVALDVTPFRDWKAPVKLELRNGNTTSDLSISVNGGAWRVQIPQSALVQGWNSIQLKIALGDLDVATDNAVQVWLQGTSIYSGSLPRESTATSDRELVFTSVGFQLQSANTTHIDSVHLWAE